MSANLPKIAVITTGGTIAEKQMKGGGGAVPSLSGEDLLSAVPGIKKLADIEIIAFANIDSREMSPELWIQLAQLLRKTLERDDIAGVVITHGTDTMEETAYFLDLTLHSDKPVVITGAMRDASAKDADGPRNILSAIRTITSPPPKGAGVLVVLNNYIYSAVSVSKVSTSNVQAFSAGEQGSVGSIENKKVNWFNLPLHDMQFPLPEKLPKVDIVMTYPGADGHLLDAAVKNGAKGIVVLGYGAGNVNRAMYEAIQRARKEKDIPIVLKSRAASGNVFPAYGGRGGGVSLKDLGVVFDRLNLQPGKARIVLMLALATADKEPKDYFSKE